MTEQELREKIAKIIYHIGCTGACCECDYSKVSDADTYCKALLKADALIAAGIGDVSEWKHRAEKSEKDNIKYGRALYNLAVKYVSAANIWTITADDGKKYLAEKEICALYVINDEIKNAEKELQEERKDE